MQQTRPISIPTLCLAMAALACFVDAHEARLIDEKLYVAGKPFFPYGFVWISGGLDHAGLRRHHFNFYKASSVNEMKVAAKHGIYCMISAGGEASIKAALEQPNLVAFFLGDDLASAQLERARTKHALVRRLDPQIPCTGDIIGAHRKYAEFIEMYAPYRYPLPERSFEWYKYDYLDGNRRIANCTYQWGVVQCSGVYSRHSNKGITYLEMSRFISPAQLRLIVWSAVSHGMRGVWFWPMKGLLKEWDAGDRMAEAAIIGAELEYLAPMLVEGDEVPKGASTSQADVYAYRIDHRGDTLLILTKLGPEEYQYTMDAAVAESIEVAVPNCNATRAWSLSLPEASELTGVRSEAGVVRFVLPRMEVDAFVLLSSGADAARTLAIEMQQRLHDVAERAMQSAYYKQHKVRWLRRWLWEVGAASEEAEPLLAAADAAYGKALARQARGEYAEAFRAAREATRCLREVTTLYWRRARAAEQRVPERYHMYLEYPLALPNFWAPISPGQAQRSGDPPPYARPERVAPDLKPTFRPIRSGEVIPLKLPAKPKPRKHSRWSGRWKGNCRQQYFRGRTEAGRFCMAYEARPSPAGGSELDVYDTPERAAGLDIAYGDVLPVGDLTREPDRLIWMAAKAATCYIVSSPRSSRASIGVGFCVAEPIVPGQPFRGRFGHVGARALCQLRLAKGQSCWLAFSPQDDVAGRIEMYRPVGSRAAARVPIVSETDDPWQVDAKFVAPESGPYALVVKQEAGAGAFELWLSPDDRPVKAPGRCGVVRADDGSAESYWGQITSPRGVLRKILDVPIDPSQLASAAIEYHIGNPPHDPKTGYSARGEKPYLGDFLMRVNGRDALREPLTRGGSAGWHHVPIDPSVLARDRNTIDVTVTGTGYIYMSLDTSRNRGQSYSSIDGGKTFSFETVRPGDMRDGVWRHAEYLVRLRVTRKSSQEAR